MKDIHVIRSGVLRVNSLVVSLGNKKCLVVDPAACMLSGDSSIITSYLKDKNLECIAIVLTHCHFDHITGIKEIKNAFPNAKIAIHEKEFNELQNCPGPMNQYVLDLFGMGDFLDQLSFQPAADVALKNNDDLSCLANEGQDKDLIKELSCWKVINTPGHTPGSICIYNQAEKLLISGDTLFDGGYGRTDMLGGNESELMQSLNYLQQSIPEGTKVYPGHDNFGFTL